MTVSVLLSLLLCVVRRVIVLRRLRDIFWWVWVRVWCARVRAG